jgi:hypothetical protein
MPDAPPATQQMPESAAPTIALPARPRAARGTPRPRTGASAPVAAPQQPTPPVAAAQPSAAAPPRQEVASRPAPGRGTPRLPVRDPSNPESFRGADGMIDAAEMRRAQLEASRATGTPSYSVQREWEAVAAEQQRAEAAGEVRVDPLAGTVPVAPPPETRAERRAREAEEAAEDAADARASSDEATEEEAASPRRAPARGGRGTPRTRSAPAQSAAPSDQSSETQDYERQVAADRARRSRAAQPTRPALDREPRLAGGPG